MTNGMVPAVIYKNFLLIIKDALARTDELIYERAAGIVQGGPFKGMRMDRKTPWNDGNMSCKFIGCYEFELHSSIRKAVSRQPDTVINAGCAEGYYAVGIGRALPYTEVFAMDMNEECLEQCERNAQQNGIIKLALVGGKVGAEDLSRGGGHRLYIVDIEGYELAILDPARCPELLKSDIIVECHDFLYVGDREGDPQQTIITDLLQQRFSATHDVERIEPQIPLLGDYPCLQGLEWGTALLAVTEKRPLPTAWLACWAKERRPDSG